MPSPILRKLSTPEHRLVEHGRLAFAVSVVDARSDRMVNQAHEHVLLARLDRDHVARLEVSCGVAVDEHTKFPRRHKRAVVVGVRVLADERSRFYGHEDLRVDAVDEMMGEGLDFHAERALFEHHVVEVEYVAHAHTFLPVSYQALS